MFEIAVRIHEGGEKVALKFPAEGEATTVGLEALIHTLQEARARMTPPVPDTPATERQVYGIPEPSLWVEPDALTGGSLLALRHPGLGWLWFQIPPHQRQRLLELLIVQQADTPAPSGPAH